MTTDMKKPGLERGRVDFKTLCSMIKPTTQMWLVLHALRQRPMSAQEIQRALPIADARAVVRDLKAKGAHIKTDDHPNPNPYSRCRTIQRYRLVEPE